MTVAALARKTLHADVRVKDADLGIVELVFSTFNKVDKDGDVTLKGAFVGNPPVVLSAYGHKSWDGALPYGVGTITETDNEAIAEVKFEMNSTHGRDAFLIVKMLSEAGLQEWSYSLEDVEAESGQFDGKSVRFLKRVFVKEVSPVLRGAGTDTRTLGVKGADHKQLLSMLRRMLADAGDARFGDRNTYVYVDDFDVDEMYVVFGVVSDVRQLVRVDFTRDAASVTLGDTETQVEATTSYLPKGLKFSEHTDAALCGVKQLVEMAVKRLPLRAAEGKSVAEQCDAYERLCAELEPLKQAIAATQSNVAGEIEREYLRFLASSSQGANT